MIRRRRKKSNSSKSGKVKLLIATDSYLPRWDGVARFLINIIPKLTDKFEITVVAPKYEGSYEPIPGIKEVKVNLMKFGFGDYTFADVEKRKFSKIIKQQDVIWTQTIGPIGKHAIELGKHHKKKIVSYIHSIEWELASRSLNNYPIVKDIAYHIVLRYARKLYKKANLLMVPSGATGDIFDWKHITTEKVILPLGIDTKMFKPTKDKDAIRYKLGLKKSDIIIGFVGRIAHEKNLQTLVRAYIRIKEKYPNLKLIIVGDGVSELKSKFARVKGVILTGSKQNVNEYLQAFDMYVIPSLTETTSLSTLEAMASGVPVIVTPVGDMRYYIQNEVNGLKFKKEDSYDLSLKLIKLIEDEKLRKKLAVNGYKTVIAKYSWESTAKEMIKVLEEFSKR